ncbi:ABC transporter ATP-binding protein [Rhodococcus maanshanensis]|uniref:ABC-type multidrug transport system, ATPase and permease component n=1 Tax=Rhodococcus maanshanensis TaxID=183556 RepID=A0A1H7TD14_9NOCA|nr:ABC transporter ATP-binding protein [Rhodococcus maanshanensis]SEL82425.1 ABC-type multidrug transport system, ATPase and permease component [Rhodococcus maanshanensis]
MSDSQASVSWPHARLLWSYIRPHRKMLGLGMVLGIIVTASGLATPMIIKYMLDTLSSDGSMLTPVLTLLGVLVVTGVVGYFQWILLGTLAARVVYDARESIVRRYFRATVGSLTARPSGELVTRVTSDTVLLREATSSSLVELFNAVVSIIGTLVLMAMLDLVLFGATVASLLVVGVLALLLMPQLAKSQRQAQESVGRLGGVLEGALRAIRTVKSSRAEAREAERIIIDAKHSQVHSVRAARVTALVWIIAGGGMQLAIIGILAFGAYRVSSGALAVSALVAFLLYAFLLTAPVTAMAQNVALVQSGIAAASRIREVHDMEVEEHAAVDVQPLRPAPDVPVLELVDVVARYAPGTEPSVRGVSAQIPARGHTAIVGPSGAGKTTLFSLLLRFLHPESGEILLDGVPYSELPFDQVRSRLAYVEQETPIVPGTIRSNLLFTHQEATEEEVWAALRAVHLEETVRELPDGLDSDLSATNVSGGQRQRIALARAIVRRPDVLLLDEATAQVDGRTEAAIHDMIRELSQTGSVVTIAHRLSTVIDADTILVMERGRIRARGTHLELLESDELYRELVTALRIGVDLQIAV